MTGQMGPHPESRLPWGGGAEGRRGSTEVARWVSASSDASVGGPKHA
jgi:hypothetical protein